MAQSQKSALRFVRNMLRLRVPSDRWNELNRQRLDIKKESDVIGLSLLSEQGAAALATVGVIAFLKVFNQYLLKGLLQNDILHQHAALVNTLFSCALYVAYMAVPFLLISFFGKNDPFRAVPTGRIHKPWLLLPAVPVTLALYFVGEFITGVVVTLFRQVHLNVLPSSLPTPPTDRAALVFFCIQICVLAPIMEEFLFRGLIQQKLMRFGAPFAIFASSLLFAMLHGNLGQMIYAFIVGLVLGFFAYRFRSIWASVLLHACVNTTSIALDRYSDSLKLVVSNPLYLWVTAAVGLTLLFFCMLLFYLNGFYEATPEREARLPFSVAAKAFVCTPGFVVFGVFTLSLIVAVMCGLM